MNGAERGLRYPPEHPALAAANFNVGIRLFGSAVAFVFVAFVFAFFYLKAVNANGLWHPKHTNPSQGYGIAILVCVLTTAALVAFGRRDLVRLGGSVWRLALAIALVLSVAVVVLQIVQYVTLRFPVTNGGYASVFYGFTVSFLACWLGTVYWIETMLATTLRGDIPAEHPADHPLELMRGPADACVVWLYLLVGIEVAAYVLLYLIK